MIDKELKRQDAVVILTRLMGKETDALATQAAPSFEDITIDYYKPFLAFAEANKWVEGKKEKTFGFNDVTTVKEFAAMLLRALGHDTTGENYPKVMELAKELKLFNGATVEENAPIVRGIAFILMNNTLETAPKGEDKALVYKLGYKEEPKPQGFVVTEAKAAGRKAIDLKFSKPVDEKTIKGRVSITENKKRVNIDSSRIYVSKEGTDVRLVLSKTAKQDAKYLVKVNGVKTMDGKETVENFENTIFMTDTERPEVLSVEAINPKTLLVKTSEPINKDTMIYAETLKEIKIDGKAQLVKVVNDYRNEIVVELQKALKAGDYKVEISGLKDFDGLIAKTMEFDITVVEDKEAPVVVEATMLTIEKVRVTFDEPLKTVGSFMVNGKAIKPSQVTHKKSDTRVVEIMLKGNEVLDMGAIVEVAVQHRGQKDAMGNTVKDWTKFTFKVNDDTEVPAVEYVTVDGSLVIVKFTKSMLSTQGKYTIKNAKNTVLLTGYANDKWDGDDDSVFYIDASKVLDNKNNMEYTIILENFVDGTLRKNPLGRQEVKFGGLDLLAPKVHEFYAHETKDGYLEAKLYFNEEMNATNLLEAKNITFLGFKYGSSAKTSVKRADSVKVELAAEDNGKVLVISSFDKNIKEFGNIRLTGMEDLAGNLLLETEVKPNGVANAQKIAKNGVKLVLNEDADGYNVQVTFVNMLKGDIAEGEEGIFQLIERGDVDIASKLKFIGLTNNNYTAIFDVVKDSYVNDAAQATQACVDDSSSVIALNANFDIKLLDGSKAKDIFGNNATLNGVAANPEHVLDGVAPRLTAKALMLEVDGEVQRLKINTTLDGIRAGEKVFMEQIAGGKLTGTIKGDNLSGDVTVPGDSDELTVTLIEGKFESGKSYTVNILYAEDKSKNPFSGYFVIEPVFESAKYVSVEPILDGGKTKITGIRLIFDKAVTAAGTPANYTVKIHEEGKADHVTGALTATVAAIDGVNKAVDIDFATDFALATVTKPVYFSVEVKNNDIADNEYSALKINLSHDDVQGNYVK